MNNINFISNIKLLLAGTIVPIAIAAKAESRPDTSVINGLFTPTQSEKFFEAGRKNFEREREIFTHPKRSYRENILQIDPALSDRLKKDRIPDSQRNDLGDEVDFSK